MSSSTEPSTTAAPALERDGQPYVDGIWPVVGYHDGNAAIAFVTDVLGFEELVLVRDPDNRIVHSEYRWPEGGIVQIASADPANPFVPEPGQKGGVYVVTADPHAVWGRCRSAGLEAIREPQSPHYDPDGMVFSVRDHEGNAWSFGTYAGGATG